MVEDWKPKSKGTERTTDLPADGTQPIFTGIEALGVTDGLSQVNSDGGAEEQCPPAPDVVSRPVNHIMMESYWISSKERMIANAVRLPSAWD